MAQTEQEPDWSLDGWSVMGGSGWHAGMTRFFPHPGGRRRRVTAKFVSWAGVAPGAVHTHVSLSLEKNPVWHDGAWTLLFDDPETSDHMRAGTDSQSFVRADRALRWAVRTMERLFPAAEGWEHVFPGSSWDEGKDGNEVEVPSEWDPATVKDDPDEDAAVQCCPVCSYAVGEHTAEGTEFCRTSALALEESFFLSDDTSACRTLVDAGPVTGTVGEDVLVLADMHPSNLPMLSGRRALLVERGGVTAHLAQVAREMGTLTVMLVPDAMMRFRPGTMVVIDPGAGTVEPWSC